MRPRWVCRALVTGWLIASGFVLDRTDEAEKGQKNNALPAKAFLRADGSPKLRISSVKEGGGKPRPLEVSLRLSTDGKTPIALSRSQFSILIMTKHDADGFRSGVLFNDVDGDVVKILPNQSLTISLLTTKDRYGSQAGDLPSGTYTVRVYVNSGKSQEFDYQWLGQTYSDDYTFVMK